MSLNNQISITIPADVLQTVTANLQQCKTLLAPYLQGLTEKERQGLFKMGDKTVATVSKIKSYLVTNPDFAPSYMDTAEFAKDEQVAVLLTPVVNLLEQLWSDANDTAMLAGSEALLTSMVYYNSVKDAAKRGIPAAAPIYADLKARFSRKSNRPTVPDTDTPS